MLKRTFDLIGAITGLIFLSPILVLLSVAIGFRMGVPVIFCQQRPGLKGKIFTFYKFRSMSDKRDANGDLLPDMDRITPLGNFLRKTSLDELPSLFNVLKGDMSLVGPRPLLVEYLDLYSPEQARRHDVKPGITGWAQVNGRNSIAWDEKFSFDLYYVKNSSILFDLRILITTAVVIIKKSGVNKDNGDFMEKFRGY